MQNDMRMARCAESAFPSARQSCLDSGATLSQATLSQATLVADPAQRALTISVVCWFVALIEQTIIVKTSLMINECFGVGVVSEPRMASAGVEPWTGSSTD